MSAPKPIEEDAQFMALALDQARAAARAGEVPVGAVLVDERGSVLAADHNRPITTHDPTAHAEVLVLRAAAAAVGNYRLTGARLYVTLEPCPMCAGALVMARVARLIYGTPDPKSGAAGSVMDLTRHPALNHALEVTGGVLADQCAALLTDFFAKARAR
jgi:tRNA(adenine34) deaminase